MRWELGLARRSLPAIGKIELDNFRERSTMGKRGSAKQGRMPAGAPPYGYRTGDDGKPEICEPEAEVVRRIFHMYVHEGLAGTPICERMTSDDAPLRNPGSRWHKAYVSAILGREVYAGIPQIKPTFLGIAPSGIPSNIITHSKGVKCGLIRSNFPFSYSNHRPAKPKIPKPLVYAQVSPLGTSFATP